MKFHNLRLRQNVPLAVQVNMIAQGGFFFLSVFQTCFSSSQLCLADHFQPIFAVPYMNKLNRYQIRNFLLLSEWSLRSVRILLRREIMSVWVEFCKPR